MFFLEGFEVKFKVYNTYREVHKFKGSGQSLCLSILFLVLEQYTLDNVIEEEFSNHCNF